MYLSFQVNKRLGKKAAQSILNQLALKRDSVFGFPTGGTPIGCYQELVRAHEEYGYDFSGITAINLDEYIGLGSKHPQSYARYMREQLFDHVNIKKSQTHIPSGIVKDTKAECRRYEALLKKYPIDLQLLGIGENGHLAFNEPGSLRNSVTRVVKLKQSTVDANARFFDSSAEVPREAISMGIQSILSAEKIVLLTIGQKKAAALRDAIEGPVTSSVPASLLRTHSDVTVITDKAAARLLTQSYSSPKTGWSDTRILNQNIIPRDKRILVISPHPDDSVVSCGATIKALSKYNDVTIMVMTSGDHSVIDKTTKQQRVAQRKSEARKEASILGAKTLFPMFKFYDEGVGKWKQDLSVFGKHYKKIKPDIILLPHGNDKHPTHALSTQLVHDYIQKKNVKGVELWYYEGLWSPHLLESIHQVFCFDEGPLKRAKGRAIASHRSQVKRIPLQDMTESLSHFRALSIPEQKFTRYGGVPPTLSSYVEAYDVKR